LQTSQVEDDSTVIKKTETESVVDSTETVQPSGDVSKHEEETSSEIAKEMPIDVEHKSEDSDSEDEEIDVVNDSGDEQINTLLKKCEENSNGNEELKFDDEYLASLCESERNGFRELLLYMRKNLRFRTKLQPSEAITDCDRLLITFEAVLNHEIDAQKLVEIQNKQKLAKDLVCFTLL
uniref:DUF4476 domain-containing protein n=1 Tax=Anisakis simplex TaxID=6269 RepID=A0A0M3JAQ1_ANISI